MGVRRNATFLGSAGILEYGLQLALPVILVRTLTPEAFGDYRLVWLLAGTALAVFPMAIPLSLFYFLPKAGSDERTHLIGNAWLFVSLSGLVAAAMFLVSWSWMPESIFGLRRYSVLAPAFLALWVMGSLIDVLPTADGNARWQAQAMAGLAIFRTAMLGLTALLSRDVTFVLVALCVFALAKTLLVPIYALAGTSPAGFSVKRSLLIEQIRYSLPFAIANAFFLLRVQADQWIVASYFSADVFALISIAAIVLSVSALVRQPLNNATLPRLSSLIGQGDLQGARDLQAKAYSMLSLILLPVLGLLYVVALEVVEIVYTPAYLGAAPLMQLYLLGQMTGVFAAGHLLVVLNAGRLATTISAICLALSVGFSLAGVHWFGLQGAVAGSVISLVVGEVWALIAVTRRLGTTVAYIMNWHVTGRAIGVVIAAVALSGALHEFVFTTLDLWPRLAATAAAYSFAVCALGMLTRLHRFALPLARGLLGREAG